MQKRAFIAGTSLIAAVALTLSTPAIFAKDSGKPAASPAPTNGSNGKSGGANNPNNEVGPESTNKPATGNNGKPASNNSGSSGNSKSSTPIDVSASPKAKPSSNIKMNTLGIPVEKVNSRAAKSRLVYSRTSPECQAVTSRDKARLQEDPCSDFIVVFEPALERSSSDELLKNSSAQVKKRFSSIFNGALVTGPLSKMQALAKNPNILVVEDDLQVTSTAIQQSAPWGLDRIDQQFLPLSLSFNDFDQTGLNSYSFVVDTGIDASNGDFSGRVAPGFTAVADGRGSNDCNGHGTHVAGIIGGATYGVAKRTTLIPVRVLDCNGSGTYSSVISGLDWISANHRPGDVAVVNMSLGGPTSSTLDGAVRNLISKGIHVVVAAGNSNADACNYSPARVLDAITVGATQNDDSRASYSNYGSCLDVFAPGSAIQSTWIGASGTNTISGTSMASPHVAGVLARFLSNNPTLTPAQAANSLKGSATKNVVLNPGLNSTSHLVYLEIKPDTTTPTTVDSTPTFKKVNPRGKK